MSDRLAYKILTFDELDKLQSGSFSGSSADVAGGFIHLSTASQLAETVAKKFTGRTGLAVASIDLDVLGEAVRWETSRDGALFPHVYGCLSANALIDWAPLEVGVQGEVMLPLGASADH